MSAPMRVKLKQLTVPQAEKEESSQLYVLNKTSNPKGNINFVISDSVGNRISVQMQITFIPIDLTTYAEKKDILRNPDFRRLVARGYIHIVDATEAAQFIQDNPSAQKEQNRILEVIDDVENFMDSQMSAPVEDQVNRVAPTGNASDFAQNIVIRAGGDQDQVEDLITELNNSLDELNLKDVSYIQDNTSDSKLKEWCGQAMTILEEESE